LTTIYHYNDLGEFLASEVAALDPIDNQPLVPSSATLLAPPTPTVLPNKVDIFNGTVWVLEDDYRGVVIYDIVTGDASVQEDLGLIPNTHTTIVPATPEDTWDVATLAWVTPPPPPPPTPVEVLAYGNGGKALCSWEQTFLAGVVTSLPTQPSTSIFFEQIGVLGVFVKDPVLNQLTLTHEDPYVINTYLEVLSTNALSRERDTGAYILFEILVNGIIRDSLKLRVPLAQNAIPAGTVSSTSKKTLLLGLVPTDIISTQATLVNDQLADSLLLTTAVTAHLLLEEL